MSRANSASSPNAGRRGSAWRKLRMEVLQESPWCQSEHCACPHGRELDLTRPRGDRWAAQVDHIVSIEEGGAPMDRANLRPIHAACNSAKENRRRAQRAREAIGKAEPVIAEAPVTIARPEPVRGWTHDGRGWRRTTAPDGRPAPNGYIACDPADFAADRCPGDCRCARERSLGPKAEA